MGEKKVRQAVGNLAKASACRLSIIRSIRISTDWLPDWSKLSNKATVWSTDNNKPNMTTSSGHCFRKRFTTSHLQRSEYSWTWMRRSVVFRLQLASKLWPPVPSISGDYPLRAQSSTHCSPNDGSKPVSWRQVVLSVGLGARPCSLTVPW